MFYVHVSYANKERNQGKLKWIKGMSFCMLRELNNLVHFGIYIYIFGQIFALLSSSVWLPWLLFRRCSLLLWWKGADPIHQFSHPHIYIYIYMQHNASTAVKSDRKMSCLKKANFNCFGIKWKGGNHLLKTLSITIFFKMHSISFNKFNFFSIWKQTASNF